MDAALGRRDGRGAAFCVSEGPIQAMSPPPWAFRPDLRRPEFDDEASLADILARCLRAPTSPPSLDRTDPASRWSIEENAIWVVVGPRDRPRRDQGWKLHLTATVHSARSVLSRVLPLLVARCCHFKFARSLRQLEILNGAACPDGIAGKFLTVYPDDDAAAVELVRMLDEATAGLDGPRILSDRPVRPDSLVHVRYGAFQGRLAFSEVGLLRPVIAGPDGALLEDRRLGRFAPPAWAGDPFSALPPASTRQGQAAEGNDRAGSPRIGDYRVEAALKRANRGGTYRARSLTTGQEVVLKEARPHVATDRLGRDARARLRHEAAILGVLAAAGHGSAPRPLDLFAHGGHLFLVREFLPGTTLRIAVRRRSGTGSALLPECELRATARGLAALLARLHGAGLIVRDFNPNNLVALAGHDGGTSEPRFALVDLELAHAPTDPAPPFRGATLGYASAAQEDDLLPAVADDLYAFGATLAFVATAADPFFLPDDALGRSTLDKAEERLALHRTPRWASDLIVRCLAPDPTERPATEALHAAIPDRTSSPARAVRRLREPALPSEEHLLRAVDGVLAYLTAARPVGPGPVAAGRRWPTTDFGASTDPACLAHGAAGVGLFLLRRRWLGPDATTDWLLDEAIAAAGCPAQVTPGDAIEGERPAGLYYGRAGVAWFLAEAAEALACPDLARRGLEILNALPCVGTSPDVMTGTAGLGLAAIRVHLATGDPALLDRVEVAARGLAERAQPSPRGPVWPIPAHFAVDGVSKTYPGYAYGLAGIATFLLAAAAVTGRDDHAALAREALGGLLAWRLERDGGRWWPTSSHATTGSPCWLKGLAGIGAGLVRAYRLTGDEAYLEAARECRRLLRPSPRFGPLTQLNGLAGIGEFFLDLADLLGEEEARSDAWEIARTIYAARIDRRADGYGLCFPDEDGLAGADYMTGVTGIASFLLRLVTRTPRLVMLDQMHQRATSQSSVGVATKEANGTSAADLSGGGKRSRPVRRAAAVGKIGR
jgi:hypothetical protein